MSFSPSLSVAEVAEVEELLDHAELGEGLRTLAWLLVEERKHITERQLLEITDLASMMRILHELPPRLAISGSEEA
jgi:hypothetical protein